MLERDIAAIIAMNKSNFPNAYKDMSRKEKEALLDSWTAQLASYDKIVVQEAFMRALQYCKFPVTLADLFAEIRKMKKALETPVEELWQDFLQAAQQCAELSQGFYYTFVEANGRTQGDNLRTEACAIFNSLEPVVQDYVGNLSRLINFGSMERERLEQIIYPAFRRSIEGARERGEVRRSMTPQVAQLLSGVDFDIKALSEGMKMGERND